MNYDYCIWIDDFFIYNWRILLDKNEMGRWLPLIIYNISAYKKGILFDILII